MGAQRRVWTCAISMLCITGRLHLEKKNLVLYLNMQPADSTSFTLLLDLQTQSRSPFNVSAGPSYRHLILDLRKSSFHTRLTPSVLSSDGN